MSDLGSLYFQLGLDDKKFNDAIEAAKQKVKELGSDVEIGVKLDLEGLKKEIQNAAKAAGGGSLEIGAKVNTNGLENLYSMLEASKKEAKELEEAIAKTTAASVKVQKQAELDGVRKRIADQEAKILAKGGSLDAPKATVVKVELDEESINQVKARLAQLEHPITPKVSIEYDQEKFRAVATTLENYTKRLNELGTVRLGIDDSFIRNGVRQNKKGLNGWLSNVSDYLLGDDTGDAGKSIKSIQKVLDNYTFKVKAEVDAQKLVASISGAVKKVPVDINVDVEAVKKKLKQLGVPLNFNMTQAIADAKTKLKDQEFKAKLNLVIDKAKVSKAIKEAFAKKGLEYQASPSDVRNARILEIQQRMEHRQKKFTGQVDNSNKSMNRMLRTTKHVADWAGQLSNQFANLISVYSLERFVRSLYTIGGEFQKQQIALRTMIGDAEKGNVVFERMKDLAVKSPFTFSDLASYTKQMAAYGIEYEELYDTTKRLADISAGVGVDMSRLILAYGQVRSAEVLRGQELRQFTEAGIPLVAELAKRLSEVRGEAVKVGEVFDAISKRQVSFDMVKDVLFDMTDPGGRFFEMQEELAKSLAGQWSNLKDAWDIMIADIANSSNNILSKAAGFFSDILRSWREWIPVLTATAGAIGVVTSAIRVATTATTILNAVSNANPWMKLASIILGAAGAIGGWVLGAETAVKNTNQLNAELDEEIQKWNENRANALRYIDTLKSANTSEERRILLYKELLDLYPEIFKNMKMEELMLMSSADLKTKINEETTKQQLARIEKEIEDERLVVKYIKDSQKRKTARGAMVVRSLSDDEKAKLDAAESRIAELEERKVKLQRDIDREGLIKALTPDSDISKYIEVYRELGKAVKILRKGGILGEITNPKEGTSILEYYDQLNSALKEQNEIKEKFKPTTNEYKEADNLAKIYQNAIDAIGGVWKKSKKGGKSEAEKAAERDAKAYLDTLKAKLSELGSQWDLYKDLFEATGDKRLSMNIAFDGVMPNFDNYISHLKGLMQEEIQKRGLGISVADLLSEGKEGVAKRVNDKSQTAWTEDVAKNLNAIIDSYNNANKKLREESVRNFIDIIKNSKDFAQQIADIDRKLQRDLSDLAKMPGGTDSELYNKRAEELIKRAEEEKTKVNFEEFKKSSDWVKVFDDLDRVSDATLDNMISKIEEFAKQAHLSEEVTKQLVDAMAKLRKESIERNPLQGFKDAWERLKYLKSGVVTKSGMIRYGSGTNEDPFTFKSKKEVDDGVAEANDDLKDSALAVADKFQAVASAADLLSGIFDGLGVDLSGLKDILGGIAGGAQSGAGIASALGYSGPWGAIAGAAIGAISALFAQVDKNLQKEIESSERREKEIGNLAKNLQTALERNMGGIYSMKIDDASSAGLKDIIDKFNKAQDAYAKIQEGDINWDVWKEFREFSHLQKDTIDTIKEALKEDSYYDAQLAALKVQRDEVKKQMQLEDEKKKTDKDKMLDYKQQIHELDDTIEHFAEEMANTLYGIDFKDWAEQLAASMVDAWASGEDAAEAYKKTVNDILKDLGVSMISQQILEPMLNNTMKQFLAQFDKDNGKLTDSSMEILAGMADGAEYAAKATEAYLEGLKKLGIDLSEKNESEAGGLSKGIQSVTEDTANLLASYVNSIRQSVHVKQQLIEKLVSDDIPKINYLAEAQLRELSQIQSNTARNVVLVSEIRDLVNRVVDKGSNKLKI